MTRLLFVTIPEKGHIHPLLGPAAWLRDRGHVVGWWAAHDIGLQVRRAGFEVVFGDGPPPEQSRGKAFAEKVRDKAWLRGWIRSLLLGPVPAQVDGLRAAVREFQPAAIVADPMVYAAPIVAHLEKLPWAALSSSLNPVVPDELDSELVATVRGMAADRDALFAKYGLRARFRVVDCLSPHVTVVFSSEAFAGAWPDVRLVGPSLPKGPRGDEPDFPWARLTPAPLVYCSFGSQLYHQPAKFRTVIEAVRGRPVQLVCAAGGLELPELPENVVAVPYAPQLRLLQRAKAIITHGGANSVMEALAYGVPPVVSAVCNDQPHNAWFVRRAGIGESIPHLDTMSPAEFWRILEFTVFARVHAESMARIHASYQLDGAAEAGRLVEAIV